MIVLRNNINYIFLYWIIGCITSILNHKYTRDVFVYLDRITMFISFFIDIIISNYNSKQIILISAIIFIISKFSKKKYKTMIHLISHVFITIAHIAIILN